jgi:hypothetical protein
VNAALELHRPEALPIEKMGAWIFSTATAILVFFQLHVPLLGGVFALNLADAFALIALAAVVSHSIGARVFPAWRVPGFNKMLLAVSALLLFAFAHGLPVIGVTQWALAGRLTGWLVLLGYLAIGVLTIAYLGFSGMRRFLETLVITACVIVIVQVLLRWGAASGWIAAAGIPHNFEGYAGNRNAFAFQMLACSALLIAWSQPCRKIRQGLRASHLVAPSRKWEIFFILAHGLILAALLFSGSRAGIGTGVALLVLAGAAGLGDRRVLLQSVICAGLIWMFVVMGLPLLSHAINALGGHPAPGNPGVGAALKIVSVASDAERWETLRRGLEMWRDAPLLGAGLGVFIEKSTLWSERAIVIHSTPVWILAEFGLLGALLLIALFARLLVFACRHRFRSPAYRAVVLLLAAFAIFGQAHEIFYQRIFWLVLGICLALPFPSSGSSVARKFAG